MALREVTAKEILEVEDEIDAVSRNLTDIRKLLTDSGHDNVELNFGTVQHYVDELVKITKKMKTSAEIRLIAKTKSEEVRNRKKEG